MQQSYAEDILHQFGISVLRSAKRAPANVRRLNNRKWRQILFSRRTFAGARFAERSTDIVLKYTVLYFQWICELYYCQPYVTSFICSGGKSLRAVPNMSKD